MSVHQIDWRALGSISAICVAALARADAPPTIDQFVRELPEHIERFEDAYGNLQMTVLRDTFRASGRTSTNTEFGTRDREVYWRQVDDDDRERVVVVARDIAFRVARSDGEGERFWLESLGRDSLAIEDELSNARLRVELPFGPTSYIDLPIVSLLEEDLFRVDRIEAGTRHAVSSRAFTVFWTRFRKDAPNKKPYVGEFVFLSESPWTLIYVSLGSETRRRVYSWTYGGKVNGVPLIESGSCSIAELDENGEATVTDVLYELRAENVILEPAAPEIFTLSHYGIPEDIGLPPEGDSRYLLTFAIVALVVGVLVTRVARRRTL